MILNDFLELLRDAIYGDSVTMPTHIAIGTGTTAVLESDTALETEVFPNGSSRSAITGRTKPANNAVRLQMLVASGEANGSNLTEVGAVNAATSGKFANRMVHNLIPKTAAFELLYQIKYTITDV